MMTALCLAVGLVALTGLVSVVACAIVCVLAGTMVYSWWRRLQITNQELPALVDARLTELVAQQIQPYREFLNEKTGLGVALPTTTTADEIDLDEEFNGWMARP